MSLKKPAIASIYGGNPYMVTHGENGLLCEKQNSKALYEAMKTLMNDHEMRERMSETAYEHYKQKFTAEKMTRQLEKIYEAEVSKRKGK
jgi:glycosyltransferase involved in cell wall biosynthesis